MSPTHDKLMTECIDLAHTAMRLGEVPIASLVARADGEVIGWGWNEFKAKRDLTMHAEIAALRDAAGRYDAENPELILVTTLEPCVMCTGAAYLCGVSTIVYALPAPADGGMGRVAPPSSPDIKPPEIVGPMRESDVRAMFEQWLSANDDGGSQSDFVRQLLELT